ncbi:MAG: response regulator transcription factor [Rhodospirillales bacterium]|nr:response regulator transcription factor [Rhodospirillales bacterium]
MTFTIALVDDDRNILTSVTMALEAEGFTVHSYKDGEEGYHGIAGNPPDLAVLDIKMPRMTGLELLEKLRQDSALPIILLTSKDDETDELSGLERGADDYITKPFSQALLIARIKALLRRTESEQPAGRNIVCGPLTLDDNRHECHWNGQLLNLTVTEYLLIKTLAERPGHVKSRDQLIDSAYGENIYIDDRTIDSHVKRLRKKFRDIDPAFNQIETVYGIGYKYKQTA